MKMKTRLIHGGIEGDIHTGAVSTPIYQVSTYKQEGIGVHKGYEYSRTGNPTRHALETYMADLEGGARGLAFGSGMAALSTILSLCSQGDHLVVGDDVYGGTYRVITRVFSKLGLEATYVDTTDLAAVEKALRPNTRMIIMETPTNPLLNVSDVRAVAAIAKSKGVLLVVDNTFMTPYWQNPLDLGADIVFHSATKYLGGHSDVVAGIVVTKEAELGEQLHFQQNAIGAILGPQDSWLLLRGAKTLGIRMEEHEKNANQLAHWLQEQASISRVLYPGLASHPGHEQMKKQARGFGGMISFDVGSDSRAEEVLSKLKYFTLAESLGAVESLIGLPARMTHASIPAERRAELGITDGLLRISVGIEDVEDLMEDLEQALS
ncbi:bifunctional cystathionine gamma-lyase/homocysteine desulfhydrase [Brevibacillus laterosporus]|uniref:Bifunctional cystathionine gamma-lyase/homocysteine desulfhydrase n=1 Tax=Brevibacillus laterosporus TaxID=1465 RepID=A0AAP8QCS8_BRELA|nr:bifunctional cystathionine gamma-lyase/homocysteine desulfhydrase [Brevibacillus laterosporus]MED1662905.1 bifunctional cystathionine gamma-lyase/homocysteine desulfhydrase [Brevibacillus laterosporus]MED1668392.1 bifunctional cystathionine gamma-lyase/homocysteine desulfhydrase [Brevibacillus laterosporus]MED1717390.1 bifunctional cystathionine gamma-lyase/homocysteine desulfhydrase [Brevibacillus laterosporus]PPA81628.1 bifunctional cystathionine gamma-lyase/homocysteine desulfhydrase [Bre